MIEEVRIKSIEDYLEIISSNDENPSDFIYRGQADKSWALQPSVYRRFHRYQAVILEAFLMYILQIKQIDKMGITQSIPIQFLANCQHYNLPTRLLDWSYSHFNTLFFACQETNDKNGNNIERDGALFICDKTKLELFIKSDFREITANPKLVEINFNTPRIHSQQGCFILWGQKGIKDNIEGTYSLEEYLNLDGKESILKKIIIPFELKTKILKELKNNYAITKDALYVENKHSEELVNNYREFRKASAVICHEITKLEEDKSILFKDSFGLNLSGCLNLQALPPEPGPFTEMILYLIKNKINLVGRNDSCVCRSGLKYKKCCGQ
jgi:hypothetical protein